MNEIIIDGKSPGRLFQRIGGVFSNGMTKLLMDYPEKQRDDILRFLFEDNFGASLHHIKVEIGSDVNSSSGTVPSHMRDREDFDILRGSELWIAALAKNINPKITLEALRWGTPGWIKDDEDKYLYYSSFLRGAREKFGLDFNYLGCDQNEGSFDRDWVVKILKPRLVQDGFDKVKLVAADSDSGWHIAENVLADNTLDSAIDILNCHYTDESSETAIQTGKPLWAGEHLAAVRHDYKKGALAAAYHMLAMYPLGQMTMYEMHPALESNYPSTPFQFKGLIAAAWPWSGYYEVTKGLWATAHFSQFIKPGWRFLNTACFVEKEGAEQVWGIITLKAPDEKNWSLIAVNACREDKKCSVHITGNLDSRKVFPWITTEGESFKACDPIIPEDGRFILTLPSYSICSISTTQGQKKGVADNDIPKEKLMELPWSDDFTSYKQGRQPQYTSDQGGAFEVEREGGQAVLKQKITEKQKPIDWVYRTTPFPCTLIGSELWANYYIEVNVCLAERESFAYVAVRCVYNGKFDDFPDGYLLILLGSGRWRLQRHNVILDSGCLADFDINICHKLTLSVENELIICSVDGVCVVSYKDSVLSSGQAALGSSYHQVIFANLYIKGNGIYSCLRYGRKDSRLLWSGKWEIQDGDYADYERRRIDTEEPGASLVFSFEGTGVSIIGNRNRDGGMAEVWLDDIYMMTVDTWCETKYDRKTKVSIPRSRNSLAVLYNLPQGKHSLRLVLKKERNCRSEGRRLAIECVEIFGGKGLII